MTNAEYYYANDQDVIRSERAASISFAKWLRKNCTIFLGEWVKKGLKLTPYSEEQLFDLWLAEECTEQF